MRLPECGGSAGSFVPVRRGLQLRPDVHVPGLRARERAPVGEPVMHADTGLLAVVGSVCMSGPFAFFLVFERLRLTPPAATSWR
jgi:hypothetical protein